MYYVFDDGKNKFESMTREQIMSAIAQATGTTPSDADSGYITTIKEQNSNKGIALWVGTQHEYNAIENPDENTLYCITDPNETAELQNEIDILRQQLAALVASESQSALEAGSYKIITVTATPLHWVMSAGLGTHTCRGTLEIDGYYPNAIVVEARITEVDTDFPPYLYEDSWTTGIEFHLQPDEEEGKTKISYLMALDKVDPTGRAFDDYVLNTNFDKGTLWVSIAVPATNSELADIRVGADGYVYPSAGEAVRAQFRNLGNSINEEYIDEAVGEWMTGHSDSEWWIDEEGYLHLSNVPPDADDRIVAAVNDWLDDHPEATTTVQDGSITDAKFATSAAITIAQINALLEGA